MPPTADTITGDPQAIDSIRTSITGITRKHTQAQVHGATASSRYQTGSRATYPNGSDVRSPREASWAVHDQPHGI